MKSNIIKSVSSLKRYPLVAFILSLLFTGMGQVYNGELAKGIIFFSLRILFILIIPLYAVLRPDNFSVLFFLIFTALNILVWIISPFESLMSARPKKAYNLRKYNSLLFYFIYCLSTSSILILSVLLNLAFFSIGRIETESMNPYLKAQDYILINKYSVNRLDTGDIVIYPYIDKTTAGRIIARDGDLISKKDNYYYVNNSALTHGILSKDEMQKINAVSSDNLFFEKNGERKYPVLLQSGKSTNKLMRPVLLGADEIFIAFDNRNEDDTYAVIKSLMIKGKVEGIIFGKGGFKTRLKKILSKGYLRAD